MTWDLREQVLLATWAAQGHEFRTMNNPNGAAMCLRCQTIVHVRSRAQALAEPPGSGTAWRLTDPAVVRPCRPGYT